MPVPAWVVGSCIGKTLTIWYETASDSSFRLELTVEVIDPEDMPIPTFLNLTFFQGSWWLDMAKFPGNADVELCAWPFIAAGQRLWVEVVGNEHQQPMRFYWILEDHVVTAQEAQEGFCFLLEILRKWLEGNDDWSSLTIHAGVTYDGEPGTPPEDPDISHIPANAHPFQRATANLRLGEAELNLPPPTIQQATCVDGHGWVINSTNAVDGLDIVVMYDRIRPGDRVCLTLKGTPGPGSPVVPCIEVQEGQTHVDFHVPPSAVSHNLGLSVKASYTVDRETLWPSPSRQALVLPPHGLSGIDVDERTADKLCLNNFEHDATATVSPWLFIAQGQTCWMWIVGELEDGSPFHWDILTGEPVTPEWVTAGVSVALSRDELEKLADCLVFHIHFAVSFTGSNRLEDAIAFLPLSLEMVQKDLKLAAPSVREAVGKLLTVWNGRDGVTVRVKYDGMSRHHIITLCWEQAGVCLALAPQPGNAVAGYVDFSVSREAVIHGIGKTVPIRFSVASRCKQATSPDLELETSWPVRLSTPVVPQATPPAVQGGILDLRTFLGDASIVVAKWWFILLGQIGWLKCTGTAEDGSSYTINVAAGHPITAGEVIAGLDIPLLRTELEKLRNKTALVVFYEGTPDVGGVRNNAIPFPVLNLEFRKAYYHYTDFDPAGQGWHGWKRGPGATNQRDLVLRTGTVPGAASGFYLEDWGYTNTRDPATQSVKLYQDFIELEVGRTYQFSAWVRDSYKSGTGRKPGLVLTAAGVDITLIRYPGTAWELLSGTFIAGPAPVRLTFDNRVMGIDPVNDFDVSAMTVKEV
ncbi:hypothetical protein [Edaphovirga cremea]|uniref:hypothetical protein n=1 Tax=Edaphovirga cremea TaxID=2267246 RepID=UPI00398A2D90